MSIFPFVIAPVTERVKDTTLPEYREMAYDYENNCLLKRGGKHYTVSQNEALKIWIYKALKTKRYVFPAYTSSYGSEVDAVLGSSRDRGILESEIKRYITEAIMVNPYIQELSNFVYKWEEGCRVTFEVTTIYDKFTWESEVYVT